MIRDYETRDGTKFTVKGTREYLRIVERHL